jgi:hypothetical protein
MIDQLAGDYIVFKLEDLNSKIIPFFLKYPLPPHPPGHHMWWPGGWGKGLNHLVSMISA